MKRWILFLVIASINFGCGKPTPSDASTAACPQKISGEWKFGQAPYGCQLNKNINVQEYENMIYFDSEDSKNHTQKYVSHLHQFMSEMAAAYIQRRDPQVTQEEINAWTHLTLSTAHQESFWTHYRVGEDGALRFFKGDAHHGYGLMQIDDRWHKGFIRSGKVYDLEAHFVYGLDILYNGWSKALKTPCPNGQDLQSLSRSAYGIYNGGRNARCRWQNSGHRWARNDKNFLKKYQDKSWKQHLVQL